MALQSQRVKRFVSGGTAYCFRGIFAFLKLSEVVTHLQFID